MVQLATLFDEPEVDATKTVDDPASRIGLHPHLIAGHDDPGYDWRQHHGLTPPTGWTPDDAQSYAEWLLSFQTRPWDWVLTCYPWGEKGSPLEDRAPEVWQRQWLMRLQKELQVPDLTPKEKMGRVIRMTTAAGTGVGKTTLVAWLVHWFMSVYPHGEAVITAGTRDQLDGKTWRELAKWQPLALNGWQFTWTATRYRHNDDPNVWFAEARAWSESNPQAMAGTHEKYVLILFDEASAIANIIWETVEGAMTNGLVFFFAFGNPMELDNGFHATHKGRQASRWIKMRVDAREVTFANHAEINGWIETYGADSDFCRTHIYGMFPLRSELGFIDNRVVQLAVARVIHWKDIPRAIPKLMGVDIARQGVDANTLLMRQGRKLDEAIEKWHERDTMATAQHIARRINEYRPDRVYIDGVGIGAGVVDYLRMSGYERIVVDVQSGMAPKDRELFARNANMRAVMWSRLLEWLRTADIPFNVELMEELCAPKYRFMPKTDRLLIESKDDMRARGVASPNIADALAYTFWEAIPVLSTGARFAEPDAV